MSLVRSLRGTSGDRDLSLSNGDVLPLLSLTESLSVIENILVLDNSDALSRLKERDITSSFSFEFMGDSSVFERL